MSWPRMNGAMDPPKLPESQRALKVLDGGSVQVQESCPLPKVEEDEVLVRVKCVAVNPVDAKVLDMKPHAGATLGCEFAGDIVSMGPQASSKAAQGDKETEKNKGLGVGSAVFGCVLGNHPTRGDNGAFAQYVAVPYDLVFQLPPHLSYQQGASLGTSLPTVGLALFHGLKLRLPYDSEPPRGGEAADSPARDATTRDGRDGEQSQDLADQGDSTRKKYVLVYGGSTSCGAMAIQMIRKSGLVPIATCSPHNFALVKSLGADEAFDYHSPTCAEDMKRHSGNSLSYVLDCITTADSMRICYGAIGSSGGRYMGLDPIPQRAHTRRDVKPDFVLVYTMFGKEVRLPRPFHRPARAKDRSFATEWYRGVQTLVDSPAQIQLHPIEDGGQGLETVIRGIDRIRRGDLSGKKLVYDISCP